MLSSVFGFNQKKCIELGITVEDLAIMTCIHAIFVSPSTKKHWDEDNVWVYIDFNTVIYVMPILDITEEEFITYMQELNTLELIPSHQVTNNNGEKLETYFKVYGVDLVTLMED